MCSLEGFSFGKLEIMKNLIWDGNNIFQQFLPILAFLISTSSFQSSINGSHANLAASSSRSEMGESFFLIWKKRNSSHLKVNVRAFYMWHEFETHQWRFQESRNHCECMKSGEFAKPYLWNEKKDKKNDHWTLLEHILDWWWFLGQPEFVRNNLWCRLKWLSSASFCPNAWQSKRLQIHHRSQRLSFWEDD